jgi:hypothetical protein
VCIITRQAVVFRRTPAPLPEGSYAPTSITALLDVVSLSALKTPLTAVRLPASKGMSAAGKAFQQVVKHVSS